jgi:hypothetical protein
MVAVHLSVEEDFLSDRENLTILRRTDSGIDRGTTGIVPRPHVR